MTNPIRTVLCVALVATLAACQGRTPDPVAQKPADAGTSSQGALARRISEAARGIENENITLLTARGETHKAQITPAGDLIVDGKQVALDARQRQLLLDYRARMSDIAQAVAAVGAAGAELAGKALTEALGSIFSGKGDDVGKRVEAQAESIKAATRKLCDRMPALREAQRRAAAAIPEFAPFALAKDEDEDGDKCGLDVDGKDEAPSAPAAPAATPAA